jgi:ABC-type amino acid transport substrate-binding protein
VSDSLPVEERIALWFEGDAPDDVPDRVLDAAFERTRVLSQVSGRRIVRPSVDKPILVLAAVLLIAISVVATGLAGALLSRVLVAPPADQLARVQSSKALRVAIASPSPDMERFDADVAQELARRLGVAASIVPVPAAALAASAAWDVALPAVPTWSLDRDVFLASTPYYAWPRAVLVPRQSSAISVADVGGLPICAVAGDGGERWLLGGYGPPGQAPFQAPAAPSSLAVRDNDAACLAALREGSVAAIVTATMSPAQITAATDVRSVGSVPPEPRSIVVGRAGADPTSLAAAVESVLAEMRRDGTLQRLSTQRFGGDLSVGS